MPSKQLQPSTSSSTASSTVLPSSVSSTSTTATYPPIPYPLVSPASSSATYPPIPYPRKSSVSVSSNCTSTASTSTSTSTSSDKGYHTSVSNIPLSPISLASWKSAEDTTALSDELNEGGVSTPTVSVVGLPGQAGASSVGNGQDGEGVMNSEDGQGERGSTWVRARTDLYPVPASTSVVSSLVLDGGAVADTGGKDDSTRTSEKKKETTVKQDLDPTVDEATKINIVAKQPSDSNASLAGEGPTVLTNTDTDTKAGRKLDKLDAKDSQTQANNLSSTEEKEGKEESVKVAAVNDGSANSQANEKPKKDEKDKKDVRNTNTNTNIKDGAAKVVEQTHSEAGTEGGEGKVKAVTKQTSSEDATATKDGTKSESKEGGVDVSQESDKGDVKAGSKQESGKGIYKEENLSKETSKKTGVVDESTSIKAGGKKSKGKEGTETKASKDIVKLEDARSSKGSKESSLVGRAAASVADTAVKDKSNLKEGVVTASKGSGESSLDLDYNHDPDLDTTTTTTTNKPNLNLNPASSDSNPATLLTLPMTPNSLDASTPQGTSVPTPEDGKGQDRRLSSLTIGSIPSSSSNSNSRPTSQSILRPSITTTTPSGNVVSRHTHSQSFAYSQPTSQQHPQQQKRSFSATHSRHQSDTSTSSFMANHTLRFDAPASTSISTSSHTTSSHTTSSLPSISTISSHPHHPHPHPPHTPSSTSNWGVNATTNATAKELTNDLLSTMKQTLSTMGATFDVLGEQTVKVAVLPAVLDVFEKIAVIRQQLEEQHVNQEGRMQEMKTMLLEEVRMKVYGRLKEVVGEIVKGVVAREVQRRVRRELYEQIPQKMRDEVEVYKRQIVEVRVSLHNSEARRHNALIRANSLDEPLIPLLRPPPQPLNISIPSIGSGTAIPHSTSNNSTNKDKALSAYTETEHAPPPLPLTARVFSESQAHSHSHSHIRNPKKLGKLDTGVGRLRRELGGGGGGEVGTPSPFFPRDLMGLMRMGGEDAKMLLREYGLVRVRRRVVGKEKVVGVDGECVEGEAGEGEGEGEGGEKVVEEVVEEEEEETREESINRFLAYIGVGFQVVPSPDAPTGVVNLARVK